MNPLVGSWAPHDVPVLRPDVVAHFREQGWWGEQSLSDLVRERAASAPGALALSDGEHRWTWADYDRRADAVANAVATVGLERGERVGVFLPDGCAIHAVLLGCARAGIIAVGIGARAGDAEIAHILTRSQTRVLVTTADQRGRSALDLAVSLRDTGVPLTHVFVAKGDADLDLVDGHQHPRHTHTPFGPAEVSMLNSTSGTTGLPKCVTQFDHRWIHFSELAIDGGQLTAEDVILAVVPTPFGFGLWTSHFLGPTLGAPTIVLPRFDADTLARVIAEQSVTVLCAVTTQFRLLLGSRLLDTLDLSSLRVMFTGGEAIPVDRAVEFEARTGATLLQFFGSNESGAYSCTTTADPQDKRLTTSGRLLAHMHPVVLDEQGRDVTASGHPGRPAGQGPLMCAGYFRDEAANEELFTSEGDLLMGDIVTVDTEGYLQVVGRQADIIIRGGKNISAVEVENAVETHPDVALVAAVAVPDATFGERVCVVVQPHPGAVVDLASITAHLQARGVSREWWPEHLLLVPALPRSSGGKIAKGEVRALAHARLAPGTTFC